MAAAERLSITLPHDLAEMIRMKVRTGDYASNSDVIRDALRLWQQHEEATARKRVWLRDKLDRSLADARPSLDADAVFAELETRYRDE
jgi:antitoxin ParD1/3/4